MELVSVHEASLLSAGLLWPPCIEVAAGSHSPLKLRQLQQVFTLVAKSDLAICRIR